MRVAAFIPVLACAVALAGCFSSSYKPAHETRCWAIEAPSGKPGVRAPSPSETAETRTVRLGTVSVMAPWDGVNLMVRRADGSLARDPYNLFAAQPAALVKAPLMELAGSSGVFGRVLPGGTAAAVDAVLELTVSDLSLDCARGSRAASVSVSAALVSGAGRKVLADGAGAARADASSGDYGAAFSEAFAAAVENAFSQMK